MKKKSIIFVISAIFFAGFTACSSDDPKGRSIFSTEAVSRNAFEQWLLKNYIYPYNVEFQYKLKDAETDLNYTLVPADSAKAAKLAIITKHLWFDAYNEIVGPDFVKENAPRVLVPVGTSGYTRQNTETLGTAEGGYKVTLTKVNALTDDLLKDYGSMTEFYFHTMHHEFMHILNQKKPYNPSYDQITASGYISGNWTNISRLQANRAGFVSAYAMENGGEDIAEMFSYYVTYTPQEWNAVIQRAGTNGAALINQKLRMVKDYMQSSWGIDIDDLRDAILRRGNSISTLDLEHLN